jgi:sugar lactone lactonase YvrE
MGSTFMAEKRWPLALAGILAFATSVAAQNTPLTFGGMTTVASSSAPVVVTLTAQTSGTLSSLVALTGGSPNLDFAVTPITCVLNMTFNPGDHCTVSVVFSPQYPGVRQGAVVATAGSQLLAGAPLSGIGEGSLPVLVPGTINTVAGDGDWIYQRDGIPAIDAAIFLPSGLAVDAAGNLFLCDSSNNRVRRVDATSGNISTVAGNGSPGGAGDGGLATGAELSNPSGLAIDGGGNLYIADTGNNVVRRVDAISGVITTYAGQMGTMGYAGDGSAATSALLTAPRGLALMPGGDLLITDSGNNAIRQVNLTSNQIQTIAGTGVAGYNGDSINATLAQLNDPYGVAVRSDGAIAIADLENQRVRLINTSGVISTALGTGQRNAGTPTQEQLDGPADVAFDPAGDLFVADAGNNRVRVVLATGDTIQTLTGTASEQFAGDGGAANLASVYGPYALAFDAHGNMWLSDTFHNRVREITGSLLRLTYATIKVGNVSPPVVESLSNEGNANLILSTPVLTQAALDSGTTTCSAAAMAATASCNMGIEFAPTMVGANITGSISWPSNAPNVTPLDSLMGQVLSVDVTSIALSSSKNPGVVEQTITLTATVTSANGSRIGTVTFSEGSSTWCAAVTLNSGGTANCVIPGLALGSHIFTASYSGDANDAPSTSPAYTELIKQQPALVLSVAPGPAVVTSNVTLSLTAVDQSGTPTGSIVFDDGATTLATVALDGSGNAQWSTQALSVGNHSLSAHYGGDSANISGASNTVNETITEATTATALALSASSARVGTALIFTATVTNNSGPPLTGSVTFKDGATVLGSQPLSAGSSALTVSTLAPGSHSITAAYSGDTDDGASTSALMTETITQIATVTTLGSDANVLNAGATLHLTTSVSLAPGGVADGALTGNVTFQDGSTVLGVVSINSGGQATLAVSTLSVGSHSLTASFAGNTNYAASNSSVVGLTVQQTGTQTTLSATSSTTLAGKPAGFSVTVTSATGIPTGQVSLRDSSTVIGTATLSLTGSAAFSTSALTRGTHSITAAYGGDSNYLASISAVAQQTVQLAQPTVTLSGPAGAVDAGTSAAFMAALTTPGVTPTGTVTLLDGSFAIATATVSRDGSFAFATAALSIGNHTITASYSGDANNSAAVSQAATVVIRPASSTTRLITSVDPLIQGNALTLTATVTSDSPNAGGQISFLDGTTPLGMIALGPGGTASLSATGLAAGTHALTAVYSGDTNHAGSTSASTTELVLESASATLSSSNNPAASGQNVTFTVQLGGADKAFPTGTATLSDNGVLLAAFPLNNTASGSFSTRALIVGSHTITLSYAGDQNFAAATSQLVQTVVDANTQTTLAAPANPATYAQPVSLVATVTSNGGAATGAVNFTDAGANIGAAQLNASGAAMLTLSTLAPGSHGVIAQYAGDGKAAPSASTTVTFSVKQTTALAVSSNSTPGFTLSPISFTASATNAGAAPATGTINFTAGGNAIGTAPLDGTGRATLTLPTMSMGSYAIAASYAGDGANLPGASAVFNETIQLRPSSTTITGSATNPANLQQITLIAVVEGQGNVTPGGTVTFTSGSTALGQASLGPTGVGIITAIFTQPTQPVTASYAGDLNYAASQSTGPIAVTGAASPPQFTLSVNAPSITLITRQHTTLNVLIASVKGFTDTIALGCSGLPKAATCTFTPSQVALSANGEPSASLTVDTGDPLGAGSDTSASLVYSHGTFLCCLPLGLLAGLLRRRAALRNLGVFCLCAAALALTISVSGCSGLTTGSTAPGTYTFKVVGTAAASGLTETQTITLVVTQ